MIRTVLINFAVCTAAAGILEALVPHKNRAVFRLIALGVLLASILTPFLGSSFELPKIVPEEIETTEGTSDALLHTANMMEKEIYADIEKRLISLGLNEYEINIGTKTDEKKNEVVLEKVEVSIGKQYQNRVADVQKELKGDYGEVLNVTVQ